MTRLLQGILLTLGVLVASGCRMGGPGTMFLSMSAYTDRPVVVTDISVNGQSLDMTPRVVRGRADTNRPREHAGGALLSYPAGADGQMQLDLTWVELPSGAGYRAAAEVPLDALEQDSSGAAAFMPVFAPGGLLIVASDPMPQSGSDTRTRDIVRLCATRTAAADKNFTQTPGELPGLREALASARSGPAESECKR